MNEEELELLHAENQAIKQAEFESQTEKDKVNSSKIMKKQRDKLTKIISKNRKKIPIRYNQIKLAEYLMDDDIDHLVSISNRSDGKSFNYIKLLFMISLEVELKFILIARHYTVRKAYMTFLQKLCRKSDDLDENLIFFKSTEDYLMCLYDGEVVCIITDLNSATDLKYQSNFLEDFPILVYDEFLAIEGDYLPDEWERIKTIYSSVDRKGVIPYIGTVKVIYLGNAVNFSSPILGYLNIFNRLENHPINTVGKYNNIVLEMNRNDHANGSRNTRAFNEDEDNLTLGQFEINSYNILSSSDLESFKRQAESFIIKLEKNYLKVQYIPRSYACVLELTNDVQKYQFNTELKDKRADSIYLTEKYYSEKHYKKYDKGIISFENSFTKDFITSSLMYSSIKIMACISQYIHEKKLQSVITHDIIEEKLEYDYIRKTKENLALKFFS